MSKLYVFCIAGLLLSGVSGYAADADQEAVVVPLHDPSRPPMIHAHLMNGGIRVRGEDRKDISVETNGHREEQRPRSDGMHRLDMGGSGLDIREENNVVTVKTDISIVRVIW